MSYFGTIENYDSAATTPTDIRVIKAMIPYFYDRSSNSSSLYEQGRRNSAIIDKAQAQIAFPINCQQEEVFLTSGGTESNNWAIKGVNLNGKNIAVSATEHLSVLKTAELTANTVKIRVNSTGVLDLNHLEEILKEEKTGLVSVHWVNNETGTIQPISEIYAMCQEYDVCFHTDASQAYGKIPINFDADLMTLSAHKIYGPKGVGALIIREGTDIKPLLTGGSHQHGMRAGSLPVPLIVGFGEASTLIDENIKWINSIEDNMSNILNAFENYQSVLINSDKNRVMSFLNFSVNTENANSGDVIALMEKEYGINLSKGAACMNGKTSYVLQAQGRTLKQASNSIRMSLNKFNKKEKLNVFPHLIQKCIKVSETLL